jgi:glycosyltransferase involved in cell wall biosynthesis
MEHARAVEAQGVLEVNAPLIEEQARHRGLHDRSVAERVARRVMASATALIAVSEEVAAYLHSQPNTQERVHVVPNGVDPERFAARSPGRFRRPWKDYTVGFLGTLRPWHGLAILVEAFALLHRWHRASRLLVVGDGPGRSSLMRDLAARGLWEAVHLTGAVAPEEVPEWLHSMDVGVAPYPGDASFYFSPLKVFEYMAAGLPVVCSRMGQMAQLIQHDRNGLLCPPGNAMALALELDRLRRDPALRARLGRAARRRVLRQHTWDAVVQRTLDFVGLGAAPSVRAAEVA